MKKIFAIVGVVVLAAFVCGALLIGGRESVVVAAASLESEAHFRNTQLAEDVTSKRMKAPNTRSELATRIPFASPSPCQWTG